VWVIQVLVLGTFDWPMLQVVDTFRVRVLGLCALKEVPAIMGVAALPWVAVQARLVAVVPLWSLLLATAPIVGEFLWRQAVPEMPVLATCASFLVLLQDRMLAMFASAQGKQQGKQVGVFASVVAQARLDLGAQVFVLVAVCRC
jgi:hypothetical protein